jgi:hypothetical protein
MNRAKRKVMPKSDTPAHPRSERIAYAKWIDTKMRFRTYEDVVAAGVEAFAMMGKHVTPAQVKEAFPEESYGVAGLIFFIWDVSCNDTKATRRQIRAA